MSHLQDLRTSHQCCWRSSSVGWNAVLSWHCNAFIFSVKQSKKTELPNCEVEGTTIDCSYMPNSRASHPRRLASYLRLLYGSSPQAHNPHTFKLLTLILFACTVILAITSWCESFRCTMCCLCLCSSCSSTSFACPSSSCSFLSRRWSSLTCACSCNK